MCVEIGKSIHGAQPMPSPQRLSCRCSARYLHSLQRLLRRRRLYRNADKSTVAEWTPADHQMAQQTVHDDSLVIVTGFWR
jgi:hypothetical protein